MINKPALILSLALVSPGILAYGQDQPAVTAPATYQGFSLPDVPGTMHFSLTGTQGVRSGYYKGSNDYTTAISANLGYLSVSENKPLSLAYSGGYIHSTSNIASSFFQSLQISQSFMTRVWSLALSDDIRYLPETPTSGLSGIPGLGTIGVTPPPATGQDILSLSGQRLYNTSTVTLSRKLTGSTTVDGSGSYSLETFLDSSGGLDYNTIGLNGGLDHRIDALNNVGGNYSYSRFSYPSADFSIVTQSVNASFARQWNRLIKTDVSVGPERSSTSALAGVSTTGHSSTGVKTSVSVLYSGELMHYSLDYSHGVRGGSGVVTSTASDGLIATASRSLGRYGNVSLDGGYTRNSTLRILTTATNNLSIQTFVTNIQGSRQFTEHLSGYISYGIQRQSTSGTGTTFNGFNGLSQVGAIGLTYTPSVFHLSHK